MDSEDKRNVWIAGIVFGAIIVFSLGIFALCNSRTKIFVENGYTRQTLRGADYPQWVKPKD